MSTPIVVLIGPPGAGKTTVGSLLAGLLGVDFLDTDTVVEERAGKPVADIFVSDGEQVFREMERAAVAQALTGHSGVLALGGGAVMDQRTQALLAGHRVVYLRTGFATAAHRTGLDTPRPLLAINPRATLKSLLEQRIPVYESLATITVPTDDRDAQEIADDLAAEIAASIAELEGEGVTAPADGAAAGPAAEGEQGAEGEPGAGPPADGGLSGAEPRR